MLIWKISLSIVNKIQSKLFCIAHRRAHSVWKPPMCEWLGIYTSYTIYQLHHRRLCIDKASFFASHWNYLSMTVKTFEACHWHLWQHMTKKLRKVLVERENSQPITSWHVTLPSPQNTANYKASRTAARFYYYYSEANRNLPSVMQKPITHQRTCKRWHKQLHTCKRWHRQPRTCKRWLKRTNQAMTCVTNQAPPRVAHPSPNSYK